MGQPTAHRAAPWGRTQTCELECPSAGEMRLLTTRLCSVLCFCPTTVAAFHVSSLRSLGTRHKFALGRATARCCMARIGSGGNDDSRAADGSEELATHAGPAVEVNEWFRSADEEIDVSGLRVEGELPSWLLGSLVHVVPGKFDYGERELDWAGGAAMLFKLTMREDGVSCRGRFLDSAEHRANSAANDVEVQMGFTRA